MIGPHVVTGIVRDGNRRIIPAKNFRWVKYMIIDPDSYHSGQAVFISWKNQTIYAWCNFIILKFSSLTLDTSSTQSKLLRKTSAGGEKHLHRASTSARSEGQRFWSVGNDRGSIWDLYGICMEVFMLLIGSIWDDRGFSINGAVPSHHHPAIRFGLSLAKPSSDRSGYPHCWDDMGLMGALIMRLDMVGDSIQRSFMKLWTTMAFTFTVKDKDFSRLYELSYSDSAWYW